jgi:hypothetical protein
MNIQKRIAGLVKLELNHLYTVPPFKGDGYLDCGWYCREHALHCFVLCHMFGIGCELICGDFTVAPGLPLAAVTSPDAKADHVWCQTDDSCPFDLSMTFHLFGGGESANAAIGPQLAGGITAPGQNGDFSVIYTKDESFFRSLSETPPVVPWIGFLERQRLGIPIFDLLQDPFLLLHRPPRGGWAELHGASIFNKISLHLYKLAKGHVAPLRATHSPQEAVQTIRARYSASTQKVERIIRDQRATHQSER